MNLGIFGHVLIAGRVSVVLVSVKNTPTPVVRGNGDIERHTFPPAPSLHNAHCLSMIIGGLGLMPAPRNAKPLINDIG
jgi:hypothetical protein